ncbi:hypothetical protein MNEG_10967 [Monoraphidium neglectum]|uniref:Gamma tubulin complex component C-terminal domain-containing protein n=1 Tax=Monoraphidium neglectum TaxID=145388 RepID=A0A0D2M707_9CHLO|nr:hypothetical protein MNEG_10967 [Monoraphidium neglectum]KIY96996.1 hypothetical protein MNEG_10967 [Monoraphidium neglectum]|eukprot:XP_013896016.1 hypothetical protein MNEG_10967 [Monoraphidium neglectum]
MAAQGAAAAAGGGGGVAAAGAAAAAAAGRWLGVAGEHLFLLEMGHLLGALQQYVMDRLAHGAWADLEQGLAAASSLDEVRRSHAAFQEAVLRQCCQGAGRGRGATWRHIGLTLLQLADVALRACRAHRRLLELRAQAAAADDGSRPGGLRTRRPQQQQQQQGRQQEQQQQQQQGRQQQGREQVPDDGMAGAAAAATALEVAALRGELASAAAGWGAGRAYLLRILRNRALQLGGDDEVDALLGALGFNGFYSE